MGRDRKSVTTMQSSERLFTAVNVERRESHRTRLFKRVGESGRKIRACMRVCSVGKARDSGGGHMEQDEQPPFFTTKKLMYKMENGSLKGENRRF